ncbi:MAG: hypothetical protein JRN15_22275, partial [Nitrososphaerota archaeon]|nr:hypothetical protein [Nitrososphaerota archaeon]
IVDPNGHDSWWSSITSAVSNAVSDVATGVNAISTTVDNLASDVSNAWNSIPTAEQADLVTVGVDVLAAAAVISVPFTAGASSAFATTAVGAAISTTTYTLAAGSNANFAGAVGAAAAGAVAGALSFGLGGALSGAASGTTQVVMTGLAHFATSTAGGVIGTVATEALSGQPISLSKGQAESIMVSSIIAAGASSALSPIVDSTLSGVGRPATRFSTLLKGLISPNDYPRAAYQVYGNPSYGVFASGLGFAGSMWSRVTQRYIS